MDVIRRILNWLFGRAETRVMIAGDMGDLARLAGGMEEAYVLKRVMDWCQSNDKRGSNRHKKEGYWWMYYSYKQWAEKEVQWLSARQVERVIGNLESKGLLIGKAFKEGGSKWYRPNLDAVRGMVAPEKGKIIAFDPSRNRETPSRNGETPSRNRETPFTKRLDINSFNQPSNKGYNQSNQSKSGEEDSFSDGVDSDKGIPQKGKDDKGSDLSYCVNRWGQDVVDRAVVKAQKYGALNMGAYVRRILENAEAKGEIGVHSNPLVRSMAGSDPHPLTPSPLRNQGEQSSTREKSAEEMAWDMAYGQLELQLDKVNFSTWVRDVVYVGADGGVYVLRASSTYARDMLQHRLYRNIRRVLSDVLGAEVEIKFVVDGEAVAS